MKLEGTGLSVCVKHLSRVVPRPSNHRRRGLVCRIVLPPAEVMGERERESKDGRFEAKSYNSKIKGIVFRSLHPRERLIPGSVTAFTLVVGLTSRLK